MEWGYDVSAYRDKELQYQGSRSYKEIEEALGKYYLPSVEIRGGGASVSQITSVNGKPTVYIANFTGLRSKENAIPVPRREVSITFNNLPNKGTAVKFIPFLGKPVQLKGVWNKNNLTVALPAFLRGAILTLSD